MLKLNLGCSDQLLPGYTNVDKWVPPAVRATPDGFEYKWLNSGYEAELPDGAKFLQADLNGQWPWGDSTVDFIRAYDIIEHLPNKIHTVNEAWRCLKPGGIWDIFVPTTRGEGAHQDPTHVSYWCPNSFLYCVVGIAETDRFADANGTKARFTVESADHKDWGGPSQIVPGGYSEVWKLKIMLRAVK